ncbi:MAG: endonuclease domain-containing protein [Ferruginibacter sp.]
MIPQPLKGLAFTLSQLWQRTIFMKEDYKNMHYGASNLLFENAEKLRKFPIHAEVIVWSYLSDKFGVKFRRQHPLALYIVDFYCHSLRLVIEIDGSIHNETAVKENDHIRREHIESFGITVIRFTNDQVVKTPEIVLKNITEWIEKT